MADAPILLAELEVRFTPGFWLFDTPACMQGLLGREPTVVTPGRVLLRESKPTESHDRGSSSRYVLWLLP